MRGVSASPHHQLLLPGSETVLQTRLPTVSASRPPPSLPPPGTRAGHPHCQARPASAQLPALRAAGPISSEGLRAARLPAGTNHPSLAATGGVAGSLWRSLIALFCLETCTGCGTGQGPWPTRGYHPSVQGQGLTSVRPKLGTKN